MKQLFLFAIILATVSCKNAKKSDYKSVEATDVQVTADNGESHPGKKIMETECYICHNPQASQTSMIAPPMIAIKRHYIDSSTSKNEFIASLMLWINDPEAPTKMPGAQEKFGKMPYLPYPQETVAKIAEYMYDYEIEKPKWFDTHFEVEHRKRNGMRNGKGLGKVQHKNRVLKQRKNDIADIGLGYALATKSALGKNLIKAINNEGTVGAIEFCNSRALTITDSLSVMKNAVIKRVSDKPRNQSNKANEDELGYISYYKKVLASGAVPKPIVKTENGEVDFYYPITTNTMCLQCHGKPKEQVTLETLTTLKSLYPNDKAINYDINEVRGIWVLNFDEE